uniref:Uncharacterized protein n=1 Tax=Helianthus annuus TaxID=4232 RepID=A0A251SZ07_HELAN
MYHLRVINILISKITLHFPNFKPFQINELRVFKGKFAIDNNMRLSFDLLVADR